MKKASSIYALQDPRSGALRFVGCSSQSAERIQRYNPMYKAVEGQAGWRRELAELGLLPRITLVEQVDSETWRERLVFWTAKFAATEGADLFENKWLNPEYTGPARGRVAGLEAENKRLLAELATLRRST